METDEVIYISSDDDEGTGQNKVDNKKSVAERLRDKSVYDIKVELQSNGNEREAACSLKRKASKISNNNGDDLDNEENIKVFVQETKNGIGVCNVKQQKAGKKQEANVTMLKPQLVVKEKKTISSAERDIFPMFIGLCLQKDRSEEMKVIVSKLKRRYEQLDSAYANSEAFTDFLNEKRNDIMNSKNKLYVYIAEVMNEMKSSCKGKSILLSNGKGCTPTAHISISHNDPSTSGAHCSSTLQTGDVVGSDNDAVQINRDNAEAQERQIATERKVSLLVKAMRKCERYIKKLSETEVNFDAENNSNYMKLERYKYRMVELYRKYCQYTGDDGDAGRQYLRPKHFSATGVVALDHAITSFINSKITKKTARKKSNAFTDALIFPDYNDILKCVTKCNELHNLSLDNKRQQHIAEKAFIEVGEYLQRCRRNDYWDTFSLFLEGKEDDPALKDTDLVEKLDKNKRESENKLSNIFEEFVKKQEEMKDGLVDRKTSSEDKEDEEESLNNEDVEDDDNEDDTTSEINTSIDIEMNNSSSGEDEDEDGDGDGDEDEDGDGHEDEDGYSAHKGETSKTKASTSEEAPTESKTEGVTDLDMVEMDETKKTEISDNLKANNGSLEARKVCVASTSNTQSIYNSELIKENNAISSPISVTHDLNTAPNDEETPTKSNNSLDKAKENKSNIINDDRIDDKAVDEEEEGENEGAKTKAEEGTKEKEGEEDRQEHKERIREKPLLRVRSFAKPPTTWKDVHEKDVIDLTNESPKRRSTDHQSSTSFQIGSKVLPTELMKTKYKTVVKPTRGSVINVKNITNHYVRLNAKNISLSDGGKLGRDLFVQPQTSLGKSAESAMKHLPPQSSSVNLESNLNYQLKTLQGKQNTSMISIPQPHRNVWLPEKQEQGTSKHLQTNSVRSQSK